MTMIPTGPLPDALLVPEGLKRGRTVAERVDSICNIAEPILGVDRTQGQHAYIRRQGDGWLFITRDPRDTIYAPMTSPLRGRPRYDWIDTPDGIRRGYLKDIFREAEPDSEPFHPITAGMARLPGGF